MTSVGVDFVVCSAHEIHLHMNMSMRLWRKWEIRAQNI